MSKAEIIDYVIMTLGVPVIAALGKLVHLGIKWLTAKTSTTIDDRIGEKLGNLAMIAVKSTYQAYVKPLKDAGAWATEHHETAKNLALEEFKSYLGPKGLKELAGQFGDVGTLLGGLVDTAVHDNKRDAALVTPAAAPAQAALANP